MNQFSAAERRIDFEDIDQVMAVMGKLDENARLVEGRFGVSIALRGASLFVRGDPAAADRACALLRKIGETAHSGGDLSREQVAFMLGMASEDRLDEMSDSSGSVLCQTVRGKLIKAKTQGQTEYARAIASHTITFCVGPAGTGKTYLAVAMAVSAFKGRQAERIVLTRPAVEAGEKLGFLPGDLQNKVDPYLRPLHDALFDTMGAEAYSRYVERGLIEVAPLAYMRGRTLDNSFIILDEAQNTTLEQMKMFLTRIGFGSKVVVTGDITQIDLPRDKKSGLREALKILDGVDDIKFIRLTDRDVVRHELVRKIIKAFEAHELKARSGGKESRIGGRPARRQGFEYRGRR